jgi:hypothetical protein
MTYDIPAARRFSVSIGRVRYSVGRNEGDVLSGPCCDDCCGTFFDIERWSSWCVICQDCGRRYAACSPKGGR